MADSPTIIKDIQPGRNLVIGTISRLSSHRIRNGNLMIEATISDTSGAISCVWFKSILPKDLVEGNEYEFTGNYELKYGRHALQMPKYVATGNKPSLDYLKSVPYVLPNNQPKKTLWSRFFSGLAGAVGTILFFGFIGIVLWGGFSSNNVGTSTSDTSNVSLTSTSSTPVPSAKPRGSCIDVTSYDYNWNNDMLCTRPDGSKFYTNYSGAREYVNSQ